MAHTISNMAWGYSKPENPNPEPAGPSMTLGERLRAAIDAKNKSYAWVAGEVGMTPAALSNILTGATTDPSFFTVLAIARAIGEPLSAIVDEPNIFWMNQELNRLREIGGWLVERTALDHAGTPLEIPSRKRKRIAEENVFVAAAIPRGGRKSDAFEQPNRRITARYKRMGAETVFFVEGESMTGENIFPTDLLYVQRTKEPIDAIGRIVVCAVDDLILVRRLDVRGSTLRLEGANPGIEPVVLDESSSRFQLFGIVIGTSLT